MIKNVIIYRDSYDIESVLPFSKEVNDIDLDGIMGFTRVNLKCDKNSDYLSMTDTYVVGIPYRYLAIDRFAYILNKQQLKHEVLNYGEIVSEEEANYCYEFKTGNVIRKAPNLHIVPNQSELLRNLRGFIKENGQTIGTQQKPVSRVRK